MNPIYLPERDPTAPLTMPPEPVMMPTPGYACPNGCGCASAHSGEPCPCCDADGVMLVSDDGDGPRCCLCGAVIHPRSAYAIYGGAQDTRYVCAACDADESKCLPPLLPGEVADAPPPCPCRAAQNCHPHCPCPCHKQSGLPGAPLPLAPADEPPFDCLSLLGQNADLRRRLALIASLTAKLPGTWPELFAVLRTIKAIAA